MSADKTLPELWKVVPGYPDYSVSNMGRVISRRRAKERLMKTSKGGRLSNYRCVVLFNKYGAKQFSLQSLVLSIFHSKRPSPRHHAAHINGVADDNRLENLRWVTATENERHKAIHGTKAVGERHGRSKLTAADVAFIRRTYKKVGHYSNSGAMAEKYGVSRNTIVRVVSGKSWIESNQRLKQLGVEGV